jgi:hypothetical protein
MIDIQGEKLNKEIFKRKNLDWQEAEEYLQINERKQPDKVYIQLYSDGNEKHQMPLDDCIVSSCADGIIWIHNCYTKALLGKYDNKLK